MKVHFLSAVPKRGRSKCGRTQKHAKARKKNANERKRKSAKSVKEPKKGAKEHKKNVRVKLTSNQVRNWGLPILFAGVLRGNTIRGNTTRNSERKMAL